MEFKGQEWALKYISKITDEACYVENKFERIGYLSMFLAELIRRGKDQAE